MPFISPYRRILSRYLCSHLPLHSALPSRSVPQLPSGLYDSNKTGISDLSDNELKLLVKRLNSFTLNPFSLTRREMAPFQRLLNSQSLSSLVSAVPFTQLLGIADQSSLSGPLISTAPSTRKSPERLTETRRKRKKETKTTEPKKVPRLVFVENSS